ncbi:MAG: hydantoinase B/oxoprolinase family protein [Pseudomonadota bacterium]
MDTLTRQLLWDRLLAIVEEQAQTLMRTAFSTVVREAGDLSAGVFDTHGAMLAQAVTGTPGHVNAMAAAVGHFLERYPLPTLAPGDALLTNDPWLGTGHLNDFTVVTPVFDSGDRCIALFASTSHIADVGGRGFGPEAAEVYEEGLNIPIMKLMDRGVPNATLLDIVAANVRDPAVARGDLYSLVTCNATGATQLLAALAELGVADLEEISAHIIERSREAMRAEIARLPQGTWRHEMRVDGYDAAVDLRCAVTIGAESIEVDFDGTSARSAKGINVPLNYTEAYASFGVRCVIGNQIPNNAGSLAMVRVSAPADSILNAQAPAAVSARHALGQLLPDVILGALAQVLPERIPAEGASCIWNPVLLSDDRSGGTPFVINPIFNGGTGARPDKPGLATTAFPSGVRTTPTEINEVTAPLVFWQREFAMDSGGAGAQAGGAGQRIEIEHREGADFWISRMFDRIRYPARGRAGGGDGAPGSVTLDDGTELPGKGKDLVPAGRRLRLQTPGGGGYGAT